MLLYLSEDELHALYRAIVVFANSDFTKSEIDENLINKITAEEYSCYNEKVNNNNTPNQLFTI